jgi:hypothetical protein
MRHPDREHWSTLVDMMKLTTLTCCLALTGAVSLGAQSSKTTTETKIEIKDGKDESHRLRRPAAQRQLRRRMSPTEARPAQLHAGVGENFAKMVGHRADRRQGRHGEHGKVEIKSETSRRPRQGRQSKSEFNGPYLA